MINGINGYQEANKVEKLIISIMKKIEDPLERMKFLRTIETTCVIGYAEAVAEFQ